MKKSDIRIIMNSLAEADLSDIQVLKFIKSISEQVGYKRRESLEEFCINCGIYYTGSITAMMNASKRNLDLLKWSANIMDNIYGWFE